MAVEDIGRQRLATQRIAGNPCENPEAVVRHMGALQAQDYQQAVWAIGLRAGSATLASVEQAIEDGRIIRTWPMRGTLHFIPPDEVRWRLALSASRKLAADGRRMAQLELTTDIMARCSDLLGEALSGGKRLSRPDVMALLESVGISTQGQRGYHILWYLSQSGVLCPGPLDGKQQTYVLLDDWAPGARDLPRDDALAELARRYVISHGPATEYDLAWWAGITLTDARHGLELASAGLITDVIDGAAYWMAAETPAPPPQDASGVFLLPGFDEYLLGYKERGAVLAADYAPRIIPGNSGVFRPMIVVAGQVVGTWKRKIIKTTVEVTLEPFVPLDHVEGQLDEAAGRYATFLGLTLSLRLAEPTG